MPDTKFTANVERILLDDCHCTPGKATPVQLYRAVSKAAIGLVWDRWQARPEKRRAAYFSAEFLIGRITEANLLNLGLLEETRAFLTAHGLRPDLLEEIEEAGLGNGGLGRLAACFLDSAATLGKPLDGYGLRYRYGLFRQSLQDGFQQEQADDWLQYTDPWSIRKEQERILVDFKDQSVWAVPYDMPIIGHGGKQINTLRLWQAEPQCAFDFNLFNDHKYLQAFREREEAQQLTSVLYPNDDNAQGRKLRLRQQYLLVSASLQDMLRHDAAQGVQPADFAQRHAIQLNDTHPVLGIPELIRLLEKEGLSFFQALQIARATFSYTNHTIMPEAMEKWEVRLLSSLLPQIYQLLLLIDRALRAELKLKKVDPQQRKNLQLIDDGLIHMARLAVYATHCTNGVSALHTEKLKQTVLPQWHALYPERFNNKTNGITPRRWLSLANPELSALITQTITSSWTSDLSALAQLRRYTGDTAFLAAFAAVKHQKKEQLAAYILKKEGVRVNPDFLFDVQVKRLHEYKRQLLNAFSILDTYDRLKAGELPGFAPTLYLFGAKAFPGYLRAKAIIKYIDEVARLVNGDPDTNTRMQVVFLTNYNVSYAEKIIPAADLSEQISTAGTEASGTGNMKLMLNGAVTIGTFDGANIEIFEQAGIENNYCFGATDEQLQNLEHYDPAALCAQYPRIARVVNSLVDGTFSDGETGMFRALYDSLLTGASWHRSDAYYLLLDFLPYCDARTRANHDYADRRGFTTKAVLNTAGAGMFSSDRTVAQYAKEIWHI